MLSNETDSTDSTDSEETTGYPDLDDPNLQYKIYKKREFYANKTADRPEFTNYKEIEKYRKDVCRPSIEKLRSHQTMLTNFINPNTPMTGLLLFHGVGSG